MAGPVDRFCCNPGCVLHAPYGTWDGELMQQWAKQAGVVQISQDTHCSGYYPSPFGKHFVLEEEYRSGALTVRLGPRPIERVKVHYNCNGVMISDWFCSRCASVFDLLK